MPALFQVIVCVVLCHSVDGFRVKSNSHELAINNLTVEPAGYWQFICNGWVKGTIKESFGKTGGAKNVDMCKSFCKAHSHCNFVTFNVWNHQCFMERMSEVPSSTDCPKEAEGVLSFWHNETAMWSPPKQKVWHKICDGWIKGKNPGRQGEKSFSFTGDGAKTEAECTSRCDAAVQCNTAIWSGKRCYLENIPLKPDGKDCKLDAKVVAFWYGEPDEDDEQIAEPPQEKQAVDVTPTPKLESTVSPECGNTQRKFGDSGCFFKCDSDLQVDDTQSMTRKGLALDDTTLHWCPENAHFSWPNTDAPVTSFRMFKAWAPWWNEAWLDKRKVWESLANYLKASKGQVLVGTQISCSEEEDDADWENVKEMLQIFGPGQIMGVAIGNELELLWTKESTYNGTLPECLERVWGNESYFLNKFHDRVRDLDSLDGGVFKAVKVTSVFGGFILAEPGLPFYDRTDKNVARVGPFITNVTDTYGERYAHTINIYPYFEERFVEHDVKGEYPPTCSKALEKAVCFDADDPDQCLFTWMVGRMRRRLHLLGNASSTLWVGETGWSYPQAHTLDTKMAKCNQWSTPKSKANFYTNFLKWDLNMNGEYKGPDHVFYFAMRDSTNFGKQEGFGLIGDGEPTSWCTNTTCKLQQSSLSIDTIQLPQKKD